MERTLKSAKCCREATLSEIYGLRLTAPNEGAYLNDTGLCLMWSACSRETSPTMSDRDCCRFAPRLRPNSIAIHSAAERPVSYGNTKKGEHSRVRTQIVEAKCFLIYPEKGE